MLSTIVLKTVGKSLIIAHCYNLKLSGIHFIHYIIEGFICVNFPFRLVF